MIIRLSIILCLATNLLLYIPCWNFLDCLVFYQDVMIVFVALYSTFLAFKVSGKYNSQDEIKQCWNLFGFGLLFYTIGESFYIWYEGYKGVTDAFPNIGDGFIIIGYFAYYRSYWKVLHNSKNSSLVPPNHHLKLSLVIITAFYLIVFCVMIAPALLFFKDSLWKTLGVQVYPVLDLIEFAFCMRLLLLFSFFGNARIAQPWLLLCFSSVLSLITDLAYSYFSFLDNYHIYFIVNLFFILVYGLMGLAFQKQVELLDSLEKEYTVSEEG